MGNRKLLFLSHHVYLFDIPVTKYQERLDSEYPKLVSDLQTGNQHRLREVYETYRMPFLAWAVTRFSCQEEEAREVYQEVILAFYENVVNGKINTLNSKLQTYLFGIGKFILLKRIEKARRLDELGEESLDIAIPADQLPGYEAEQTERSATMLSAINQLGENCRDLLIHVYYHRLSGEIIAERLGYKNSDVVKSQKARCMKKLRTLVQNTFSREDL